MPRISCGSVELGKFIGYDTCRFRAVFAILLLGSLAWGQAQLQQALALSRAGRFAEARRLIAGVAPPAAIPQQIAYHRLKAAIASGLGENAAAAEEMESALSLAPDETSLILGAAVSEGQAGQLEKAAVLLARAGENANAKALLGELREKQHRYRESIEAYRRASDLDPGREEFRVALAKELISLGAFDQAHSELERSLAVFPRSSQLITLSGILEYAGGQPERAEQFLSRAIATNPAYDPAYRSLAKIVLETSGTPGQPEIDALCRWNQIACNAVNLRLARDTGDMDLQNRSISSLASAPANDAIAACALGQAYAWSDRPRDARPKLEACVRLDPSPQNHYRLAQVYQKLGEESLARQELEARNSLLRHLTEQTARAADSLRMLEQQVK